MQPIVRAHHFSLRLTAVALSFFLAQPVAAQIDTGAIVGTVTDQSGASIPKASIVVTNESTGVVRNTQTNESGQYQVTALIPGRYAVKASASGFGSELRGGIQIDVQSRPAIDFALKVGHATQTIEVSSVTPVLQTQTADVGAVVQQQQINDLPLNGRRYSDLSLLEAGITRNLTNTNNTAPDRFSSNGNWETQNYFSLDGIDNNSGSTNLQESTVQVIQPPPDALQEFRIQTRTYSAEFGTSAGAVINASLKSGTNQFHGDLWEYLRNSELDANTYFNNQGDVPRGHFSQNQYGATIGGPIVKNRTFFFGDFQFLASRTATSVLSTVPTPLMKQGNFLELPSALNGSPVAGQAACVSGSKIAANCIDPTAAKLVALFPDPNIPSAVALQGQPGSWGGAPNYQFQYSVPNDSHSWDVRIDHSLNERNRVFGRYSEFIISRQDPPWTSDPVAGNGNFATQYNIHEYSAALAWDKTIAPTVLNELRGGFTRDYAHSDPIGLELGDSLASQYGLNGIPVGPQSAGIPPININGLTRLGSSPWRPQFQIAQVWQLLDNLSWLKGDHSFKFGYEYRHPSDNFLDIESPQGQISVNGIYTNNGSFGLPDFLLGDVDSAQFTTPTVVHNYKEGNGFYGQDTWRVRRNLTVTYGVRYELFSPLLNHQNAVSNFTPANGGGFITAASDASGWYEQALVNPDKNNWAPRFGFSYQPWNRIVLRGGFGIFYQQSVRIGSESILALNPPFVVSNSLTQQLGSSTPVFLLSNGFPSFPSTALYLPGLQIRAQDPNQRTSYVEQFSFGPEIQLGSNTALDLTYVGNNARKMNRLRNANQGIVTGYDATGNPTVVFPYANLNNSATGDHAFLELATNDGNSDYNAFLISLRRRFSRGLSYGISYTWSHGISDFVDNLTGTAEPQNAYDYRADRGESPFDIRSRFVSFVTYELPVGKGKPLLNNDGWSGRLLGGWQVNSIVTLQTGTPFEVNAADVSNTGPSHDSRANCIGDPFLGTFTDPRNGVWLNANAFSVPDLGTFGNCGARSFHGPGVQNVDLSLFKIFPVTESMKVEFRAESFNLFNHANFTNPSAFYSPFSLGSFGRSFNTVTDPRELQFALKFYF
jgi:hypothetical protein